MSQSNKSEQQLLSLIYDNLYETITYAPSGSNNPFTQDETFIHFAKNEAINPQSFKDQVTPSRPRGDLKATEEFSRMVDVVSPMSLEWNKTGASLSNAYERVVVGANTNAKVNEAGEKSYKEAFEKLHVLRDGEYENSKAYIKYQDNMDAYTTALMNFQMEYLTYQASTDPFADTKWQIQSTKLDREIEKAKQKLLSDGSVEIENALKTLRTSINNGAATALESVKKLIDDKQKKKSLSGMGDYFLSYPTPNNWADETNLSFTELEISGESVSSHETSSKHGFEVKTSFSSGLWSVSGESKGEFENYHSDAEAKSFHIKAKIAKVTINRPWFEETFFNLKTWYTSEYNEGGISTGVIDTKNNGSIPMFPVAFIVAKEVEIKAAFSKSELDRVKKSVEGGAQVGFGPFSIGGKYSYSSSDESMKAEIHDGSIKVPGMQIIGWVSRVVPYSPSMNDKGISRSS